MASVLAKAKAVLKDFYKDNDLMLVQRQPEVAEQLKAGEAPPPPPSTWDKPYGGKTQVSMGVVAALEVIEEDVQKDIKTATDSEKKAKDKYDAFKKETEKMIKELKSAVSELLEAKGDKEDDIAVPKKLKNRQIEIDGLFKAKGILQGAKFD